ncbi:MAG: glycosyltransferase [Chitinophagales bacterium]
MQEDQISILMPVKNAMPFLSECLSSIINQTYQNWELIAVNDHSTDTSFETLTQYANQDKRIKVLNNNGSGIIDALRLAYSKCSGFYISRMDADDIMSNNKLEVLSEALKTNGLGHIAVGKVKYFSENVLGNGYKSYEKWLNSLTEEGTNFTEIYKECVIPSPCWMVHKTDFENCGAFKSNIYPEDYDLCFRFYENGLQCIPCNETLHYWRDYAIRTSRTNEHYADNRFLNLKCHYFIKLNYQVERPLILWGAGKKGKSIAKSLVENGIDFHWLCNNPNKIGKDIYGVVLTSSHQMETIENAQIIVAVANKVEQKELKDYFKTANLEVMKDYFFFC